MDRMDTMDDVDLAQGAQTAPKFVHRVHRVHGVHGVRSTVDWTANAGYALLFGLRLPAGPAWEYARKGTPPRQPGMGSRRRGFTGSPALQPCFGFRGG